MRAFPREAWTVYADIFDPLSFDAEWEINDDGAPLIYLTHKDGEGNVLRLTLTVDTANQIGSELFRAARAAAEEEQKGGAA